MSRKPSSDNPLGMVKLCTTALAALLAALAAQPRQGNPLLAELDVMICCLCSASQQCCDPRLPAE